MAALVSISSTTPKLPPPPAIREPDAAHPDQNRILRDLVEGINIPPRLVSHSYHVFNLDDSRDAYNQPSLPYSPRGVRNPTLQAQDTIHTMNTKIAKRWIIIQAELQKYKAWLIATKESCFFNLFRNNFITLFYPQNDHQAKKFQQVVRLATLELQANALEEHVRRANDELTSCPWIALPPFPCVIL